MFQLLRRGWGKAWGVVILFLPKIFCHVTHICVIWNNDSFPTHHLEIDMNLPTSSITILPFSDPAHQKRVYPKASPLSRLQRMTGEASVGNHKRVNEKTTQVSSVGTEQIKRGHWENDCRSIRWKSWKDVNESKQIGNALMFQIVRMEAEEEGFVEVVFLPNKI